MQTQQQATHQAPAFTPAIMHTMAAPVARRFVTIAECATIRPFSAAALRDLRFKAADRKNSRNETIKGNGTASAGVWLQVGAKVLIDLDAFDCWLESHRLGGGN